MAKMNEVELKQDIKDGFVRKVYFLYGEEKMLISLYAKKISDKLMGKNPSDFNYHIFNENSDIEEIIQSLDIIPFSANYNYVGVDDFNIEKIAESDLKYFLKALADIPDGTVMVIAMKTLSPTGKKASAWNKLTDCCEKYGACIEFPRKNTNDLKRQIVHWASKRDILLSYENAQTIIEYTGTDLHNLKNETDKLCAYVEKGEVQKKDIDTVITKNLSARVYDMTDAITSGNPVKAFACLDLLFFQREEPIMILAEIVNTYVDMYRVRLAIENGMRSGDVAKDFDYKRREFRLKKAERSSSRLSTEKIAKSLEYIASTNQKMNSSSFDKKFLLEKLITRLIAL
ncbi:MAG: DNA polymerase III subunit delta [Clostridia bacterium]|nr:DNA polymerase III subunit delta [Clostridia bacterium]